MKENTNYQQRKFILNYFKIKYSLIKKKGSTLGEYEFFTSLPRREAAISKTFTSALKIEREEFLSLLKRFPFDLVSKKFF